MPKQSEHKDNIRQNWGKTYSVLPELDLLAVQRKSYKLFEEEALLKS
jgi:DNA-directed RNA polymerase subunit beta